MLRMKKKYPIFVVQKKSILRKKEKKQLNTNIFQRYWRYFSLRLLRLRGNPKTIARGLAIGVFAGCFPFFGLQTIIAILIAFLLKGNKIAAAAATWISNPLTSVPIFAFNFHIGTLIIGGEDLTFEELNLTSFSEIIELGGKLGITLLLGSLIVGSIASFCAYFISLRLIKNWRKNRK
jgi:uncharacterized protein (DUF2062 family)